MAAAPRPASSTPAPLARGSTVCNTNHRDVERERRWTGARYELVVVGYTFLVTGNPSERRDFAAFEQRMDALASAMAEDGQIVTGLVCHERQGKDPWAEFKVKTLSYDLPTKKPR